MARTTGKNTGKKTTQAKKTAPKRAASKNAKATKTPKRATKAATKATKATKAQKGGVVEQQEVKPRYYKLITIDQNDDGEDVAECRGRYSGKKPRQAASKGCTKLFRAYKDRDEKYPERIIYGMHECTRSRRNKKKFFYIGTKEDLDEPQEVPIHQKDDNNEYLLDQDGNKVPKLDPKTGEALVIKYRTNSKVKKLFCPERKEKVEVDGERRTVIRALTEEEYGEEFDEPSDAPYTFEEYLGIHAQYDLLRNYDAPDDDEDLEEEAAAAPAPKKTARAKATKKATKTTKATKATKKAAPKKAAKKAAPKKAAPKKAAKATKATKTTKSSSAKKAPVVKKGTSKNITVKKNASKGKKAAPKKAAAKKGGRKATAKKN
jgi:hypothetical protein